MDAMGDHVRAMLSLKHMGAVTFDYGNNLRTQAKRAGVEDAYEIPGFVPEYIRPLFCEGRGPFRWVALSGDPEDIYRTDQAVLNTFPENEALARWIRLARERVQFQGLPSRICWLGYGERAKLGLRFNEMVRRRELKAPIVIGRDHLDAGSVASPNRETEGMKDGSDAVADWPILNALLNAVSGATWGSGHHGGGVGMGYSIHAGRGVVADGTAEAGARLALDVLTAERLAKHLAEAARVRTLATAGRSRSGEAVRALFAFWTSLDVAGGRPVALLLDEATEIRSLAYFPELRQVAHAFGQALATRRRGTVLATSFPTQARAFWPTMESLACRPLTTVDVMQATRVDEQTAADVVRLT